MRTYFKTDAPISVYDTISTDQFLHLIYALSSFTGEQSVNFSKSYAKKLRKKGLCLLSAQSAKLFRASIILFYEVNKLLLAQPE